MKTLATCALCFSLLVACTGGQTGQVDDGGEGCEKPPEDIPPDTDVGGVVPLEAALAVEGTYVSSLLWKDGDIETEDEETEDEVTVRLAYEDGPARLFCGQPQIEMAVDVSTRDGGVEEHATAWVSAYPLFPDPTYSEEFGITLPSYARAFLSLEKAPFYTDIFAYEVPSGITLTGSLSLIEDTLRIDADDRFGHFPASDCLGPMDPSTLEPNPESIVSFLNGLSPEDFAWQGHDIVPDQVQFRMEGPGCDEFGIGRVPLVVEVTFGDAEPIGLSGELTIGHRAEDPEVVGVLVSGYFQRGVGPFSVVSLGDGSSCSIDGVNVAVQAVRLPSDETPLDVVQASAHVGCVEDGT